MSRFRNTVTGDVIDVPAALDATYTVRPEYVAADTDDAPVPYVPAATAPAGATGDPVPTFDPGLPLAAGPQAALENIEDIKGDALDEALDILQLPKSGTAPEKRDRLAERLNKEVNGG